jgi:hypothetical protein
VTLEHVIIIAVQKRRVVPAGPTGGSVVPAAVAEEDAVLVAGAGEGGFQLLTAPVPGRFRLQGTDWPPALSERATTVGAISLHNGAGKGRHHQQEEDKPGGHGPA